MISNCRLCGGDDLRLWMRDGRNVNLDYFKCGTCSLWNYDLDCGLDQTQYTEVYASLKDASNKFIEHWRASWEFLRRYTNKPGSIMDIGCGNAGLLYLARQEGWQVRGMELSEKAARAGAEDSG